MSVTYTTPGTLPRTADTSLDDLTSFDLQSGTRQCVSSCRQVLSHASCRYIDWLITTPLLLVDVLLIAKLPLASCFFAIFADIAMVITGLFGGLYVTEYRSAQAPCTWQLASAPQA